MLYDLATKNNNGFCRISMAMDGKNRSWFYRIENTLRTILWSSTQVVGLPQS